MLRVLQMIGGLEAGGSQAMIMNVYRNIDRERIQFDFILDKPENLYYADEVESLGGRLYDMPRFRGSNAGEVRGAWTDFFVEHPGYRVLHSHIRSYASLYLPIAKRFGVKTIIHSHSTSNGSGAQARVKKLLQYPLRHQADVLMACSTEAGQWLYGEDACCGDKFVLLPNGVDLSRFTPDEDVRLKYREDMGLRDSFVIGHVGRLHEAKNHSFLLEAFAIAHERNDAARLLLVGDGELRGEIEEKIGTLGIGDAVIMTGNRQDVPQLMQCMDVLAFPSRWEGMPVTLVEAQSAGLPCLISDNITHDVDLSPLIRRLPIDDAGAWAAELLRRRERLDVSGRIARSGFDIRDSSKKLCEIYEALAEGRQLTREL